MSEEKKLTDEEIVKALKYCSNDSGRCTHRYECVLAKCSNCTSELAKNALHLIHRLQSEKKELQESADLFSHFNEKLNGIITEQKAEIERLTEEKSKEVNDLVKEKVKEIFKRIAKRKHQGFDVGGFFVEYTLRLEDLTWIEAYCGVEVE